MNDNKSREKGVIGSVIPDTSTVIVINMVSREMIREMIYDLSPLTWVIVSLCVHMCC